MGIGEHRRPQAVFVLPRLGFEPRSEVRHHEDRSITEGTDSQGEVTVRVEKDGQVINGQGADTDIIVASAKAYLDALNLIASGLSPRRDGV